MDKKELELTFIEKKKSYEKNFRGRPPYKVYEIAIFVDSDNNRYEYKYDPKAKTNFASALTDIQKGDTLTCKFSGEDHYHKGKDDTKIHYTKLVRPEKINIDLDKEQDEPELLF